jgi:hypothetical protein
MLRGCLSIEGGPRRACYACGAVQRGAGRARRYSRDTAPVSAVQDPLLKWLVGVCVPFGLCLLVMGSGQANVVTSDPLGWSLQVNENQAMPGLILLFLSASCLCLFRQLCVLSAG